MRPQSGAQLSDPDRHGAESVRRVAWTKVCRRSLIQVRMKAGSAGGKRFSPTGVEGWRRGREADGPLHSSVWLDRLQEGLVWGGGQVELEASLHPAHQAWCPRQGCYYPQEGSPFLFSKRQHVSIIGFGNMTFKTLYSQARSQFNISQLMWVYLVPQCVKEE